MDLVVARETASALMLFGATGTAAMVAYRVALTSFDVDLLPPALAARVRWWRGHLVAALGASAGLLLLGIVGLMVLPP